MSQKIMRDHTTSEDLGRTGTAHSADGAIWWPTLARLSEIIVGAWVWFGLHEFAHLRLPAGRWVAVLALGGLVWVAGAALRARRPNLSWLWLGFEIVAMSCGLAGLTKPAPHPPTAGQIAYAGVFLSLAVAGWRGWMQWVSRRSPTTRAEAVRLVMVVSASMLMLLPFFSDKLIGGTDARWYACMLRDFIDQLHAGVFPVFIGQGEFAWNGGVHPFRSAPVYMYLAGFWDLMTCRALNAEALQHLTALTAGAAGGLGFYAAAAALLPTRRWLAAGWAVLYAVAPVWLGVLYCSDAYMTFIAMGALPAVLYGNARSLLAQDGRGYGWLAVGLAALWMCHPPTAMMSMLVTILLQGGSLMLGQTSAARWRGVAVGALLFAGLALYYFVGMSELPSAPGVGRADALQVAGLLLVLAGIGNGLVLRRSRWWLLAVPAGAGLAGLGRVPWFWWMAATTLVAVAAVALLRWRRVAAKEHGVAILFGSLLLGAGLAQAWIGPENPARNLATLAGLSINAAHASQFFLPVAANLSTEGNFQPGAGLWLVLAALAAGFVRPGTLVAKLFFVAGCLPIFGLVRVPWVSDFLLGQAPDGLVRIASFTLPLRTMPVLSGVLAMGGVVGCATIWTGDVRKNRALGAIMIVAVAWALGETVPFARRGWAITESRTRSEDKFRSENAVLDRFSYDLLPHPAYLSHGRTDPWLQARVLDGQEQVVIGPDQTAGLMEQIGARRLRWTVRTDVANPKWVHLSPDFTVQPGEKLLLRFEFDPKINYGGYLIWSAEHAYREYHLPASGLPLGFGAEASNSRVISIENTTKEPANYHLTMLREEVCTLRGDGDFFADIVVSHYDPARAAVRVDELMPRYRVTATVPARGWIETSRVWLPGYRATLDGRNVDYRASHRGLAMVAVTPGRHELELRYVGTGKLWTALVASGLVWLGWLFWLGRQLRNGMPAG